MRSNAFKWLTVALAPLVSFGLLEGFFRYRAYVANRDTLAQAFFTPPEHGLGARTRFVDMIQAHPNDKIIYELRPDLDVFYKGSRITTNAQGFRGSEHPLRARKREITIVGIGASIMFGHGLSDGEEYPALLQAGLNWRYPGKHWRVINTGVPSYNVVMKVETLREKGLAYAPDLVLLGIASNNLDLPNYVRIPEDPLDAKHSFFLDFFVDRLARKREAEGRRATLARVDKDKLSWHESVPVSSDKIPPAYRDLVGWEPFERALDELQALSREHGFEVIVFSNLEVDITSRMLREAAERGFHTVSLMDDLVAHMRELRPDEEFTLEAYAASELVVGNGDGHPSALQHKLAARRLLEDWQANGLIERLLAKP